MKFCIYFLISLVFISSAVYSQSPNTVNRDSLENKIFHLGEVVVVKTIDKDLVSESRMNELNKVDVGSALGVLPSLIVNNTGAKNETSIYLRGFNIRKVPVFIDGIPVYVPYDGTVDLARFTSADLSGIQVSKGYSSILYGPNAMGGTINLLSRKPKDKLDIYAKTGIMSGDGFSNYISIGSKQRQFYFQGNISNLKQDFRPLSDDFKLSEHESNFELDNSYRNDTKLSLKLGFTPNEKDEYAVNYIFQHGNKGNPIYLGDDEKNKIRYWKWPYWDKESFYFISNTDIADKLYVKTRIFYDKFKNKLSSFDDASYSTQTKRYAFSSFYDDNSYGISVETGIHHLKKNALKLASHFKVDKHKEHNQNDPVQSFADHTFSIGIEDEFIPNDRLKLIPGISYNIRQSQKAEDYNFQTKEITDYPENKNRAVNAQLASYYQLSKKLNFSFTIAYKTSFATMSDRYSYKMGRAIANPDLKAESAINYELGASIQIGKMLRCKPALFYSKLDNTIQQVDEVKPSLSQMQNTGEAEYKGGDISVVFTPLKNIQMHANYSYIEQKNISNPDILFTNVPKHSAFGSLHYLFFNRIGFVFSTEYNSSRYSSSYGTISSSYMIFNTQLSYKFAKYFKVEAGVNNLLDRNYTISEGYPEAGRNLYVSLFFNLNQ